jgi:flagellar motility protein MotE (MotC chaperone)
VLIINRIIHWILPSSTKHLLRKQREIRDLRERLADLEKQHAEAMNRFRKIHEAVKEQCDGYYWY